jgi:DUF4097 and DUF4098 domain-containing protein YvlB
MKAIKITGILLTAMMLSIQLMAQDTKEQLVVSLTDPGRPYKLNVDLVTGSIIVIPYDGKDVIIDAQAEGRKEKGEAQNGMRRITTSGGLDVTARQKNNIVDVTTGNPGRKVTLTIKVPQGASSVKLHSVNSGNITASDISGDIEVINVNGGIKLTNVGGSVVANTVNGNVVVTLKSIDTKAAMAFSTLNGNVDVTFPASLKANVKLRSDRGEIYTDFDMTATKGTAPKTTKTAKDGLYHIEIEDWVNGTIGGGGQELLMKNMNGNIYLRKAK